MKICPHCSATNDDKTWTCASCGTALAQVAPVQSAAPGHKRGGLGLALGAGAAVLLVLVVFAVALSSTARPAAAIGDAGAAAAQDIQRLQSRDYAGSYGGLANSDRAAVSVDEWTARCKEVEALAGTIESYKVIGTDFLDAAHEITVVNVEVKFSGSPSPLRTSMFYVTEDGHLKQSMLWGRAVKAGGSTK
jgi:Flp pilus assembly protein TadG